MKLRSYSISNRIAGVAVPVRPTVHLIDKTQYPEFPFCRTCMVLAVRRPRRWECPIARRDTHKNRVSGSKLRYAEKFPELEMPRTKARTKHILRPDEDKGVPREEWRPGLPPVLGIQLRQVWCESCDAPAVTLPNGMPSCPSQVGVALAGIERQRILRGGWGEFAGRPNIQESAEEEPEPSAAQGTREYRTFRGVLKGGPAAPAAPAAPRP